MYGGDEVGALVIDIGSHITKAGFAGDDTPKTVFQTAVGTRLVDPSEVCSSSIRSSSSSSSSSSLSSDGDPSSSSSAEEKVDFSHITPYHPPSSPTGPLVKKYYIGRSAHYRRDGMEIVSPINNGVIDDWDAIEKIIGFSLQNLGAPSNEHPILYAEPTSAPQLQREKLLSLSFEKFQSPALYLSRSAVLAAFAAGRYTASVLELGAGITQSVPISDGYVLHKGVRKTKMAGNFLDLITEKLFMGGGGGGASKQIIPLYEIKKDLLPDDRIRVTRLSYPHTTSSFHRYSQFEIIRDMKESLIKITEAPFDVHSHIKLPPQAYILPDGNTIDVGNERFIVAEHLFIPDVLRPLHPSASTASGAGISLSGANQSSVYSDIFHSLIENDLYSNDIDSRDRHYKFEGLHRMMISSIESMDIDIRKELYANIVLSGGTSLISGLSARLAKEIAANIPHKVKLPQTAATSATDRRFGVWIGGSILASLGSFHQMWCSKAEYEEVGATQLLLKKDS